MNTSEIRLFEEKGYGFIKFQTHQAATAAICDMHGAIINGSMQVTTLLLSLNKIFFLLFSLNVVGAKTTIKTTTTAVAVQASKRTNLRNSLFCRVRKCPCGTRRHR